MNILSNIQEQIVNILDYHYPDAISVSCDTELKRSKAMGFIVRVYVQVYNAPDDFPVSKVFDSPVQALLWVSRTHNTIHVAEQIAKGEK